MVSKILKVQWQPIQFFKNKVLVEFITVSWLVFETTRRNNLDNDLKNNLSDEYKVKITKHETPCMRFNIQTTWNVSWNEDG